MRGGIKTTIPVRPRDEISSSVGLSSTTTRPGWLLGGRLKRDVMANTFHSSRAVMLKAPAS